MYSSISLNNTERKEIGVPILKRTDEMIAEFNLDYERNYKMDKFNAEKEKAFKEYLKRQEQRQFYLRNLIKILRIYFKENNYNQDTYYFEYSHKNKKYLNKIRKKKRTTSFTLPKNKFIYYQIFKNSTIYKFYQPWIYPLGEKDKKNLVHRRLKTDFNIITNKDIVRIDKSQLKLYVEIFGVIPVNYIKREKEDKSKNKKVNKSNYFYLRNHYYSTNSFDNKTHLLLQKGKLKEKYYGGYEKMKKYIYMKKKNITNLKAKSANRLINNRYINSTKNRSSNNIFYNKSSIFKNNNHSAINKNKKSIKYNVKNNNTNNDRYSNLKNFTMINKNNTNNNSYYNNISSIQSASSFNINNNKKPKTFQNKFSTNNNINILDSKNTINNYYNKINLKKNMTHDYLSKFNNEYSKTIKKSKLLNKNISFLNRVFYLSKNNYNKTKKIFEENRIKKISMLSMVKNDIFAQKRKAMSQFKYVKENMSGNIKVNFLSFVRTPQSKLIFVRDFNKQREQSKKYKEIDIDTDEDNEDDNEIEEVYDYIDKESKNLINQKKKINIKFNNANNNKNKNKYI